MRTCARWMAIVVAAVVLGVSPVVLAAVGNPNDTHAQPVGTSNQEYLRTMTHTFEAENVAVAGSQGTYNGASAEPVIIAIIGDGVDFTHTDLDAKKVGTGTGSGLLATAMAGIAAAETDSPTAQGIAGVCRGCKILSVQANMNDALLVKAAIETAIAGIKSAHQAAGNVGNAQGVILLAYNESLGDDLNLTNLLTEIFHQTGVAAGTSLTVVAPAGSGVVIDTVNSADTAFHYPSDAPSYPCSAKN
ncbi:MAG: hypothetical protein Q8R91_02175, partial [Candidatus Omnitrophota bacterium]|nr:hypothetical protein [Candidatus Omnitrophota bacterium]